MLATRFRRNAPRIQAAPGEALSEDRLRALVPSIFAEREHSSRSARYTYLPTIDAVRALGAEGFMPTFACQAVPRDGDRIGFAKHMLRFRRASDVGAAECPEVVMVNSHDGSTSYQMFSGVFRFVCTNGMVAGDKFNEVRVQHKGDILGEVVDAATKITQSFRPMLEAVKEWKTIDLKPAEQEILAEGAAALRFDLAEGAKAPVDPRQFLRLRRYSDAGSDLWSTFNRVQENTIRGGLPGRTLDANNRPRRITTRPIGGIDQNIGLNRALWMITERMAELKAA